MKTFKMDLHHHCYYSRPTAADTKVMNWFAINESYDSPLQVYKVAKARGMDAVTMTDHNTIRGCLKLKEKYPHDTFMSEEICAFFPEDKFRMHILALDIDEKIHAEITRLRQNVYELVQYFKQENILHILAHPAWGPSRPPERQHFEKFMVLFDKWEFLNGSRTWKNHALVKALAESYTLEKAQALADKHQLPAPTHTRIIGVGGSDAHTRRFVASTHTQAIGPTNYQEFLEKLRQGEVTYEGQIQTLLPFAHSIYDICGKHYSFGQGFIIRHLKDKYLKTLARMHVRSFKKFSVRTIKDQYGSEALVADLDAAVVKTIKRMLKRLNSRRGLDLLRDALFQVVELGVTLTPLLASAAYKYRFNRRLPKADDFFPQVVTGPKRVALIGDNLHEGHGLSTRVRELIKNAEGKNHILVPVTCAEKPVEGFHTLKSIHQLTLPEYKGQKLHVPSVGGLLTFLEKEEIEMVHVLTPATVGLAALGAAKIAKLPVIGSYHTDFTDYIRIYNDNPIFANVFDKAQAWFYNQCDLVFALSNHSRGDLIRAGVAADKIQIMKTGVNHQLFNPDAKSDDVRKRLNPDNKFMILFAGRLEKEKNIDTLLAAFAKIHSANSNSMLVLAGKGNLRDDIETNHATKYPAGTIRFLDWVSHQDMAKIYASADLMLFPSTTETFGNVILEAQSCALPTLVSDQGAAAEIITHEKTGYICDAFNDSSYAQAALRLMNDAPLRMRMRQQAELHSRDYTWKAAVDSLFHDYSKISAA